MKWRTHRPGLLATLTILAWGYLTLVLVLWFLLRFYGDVAWFPTVLLFGPRWPYAIPLGILGPVVLLGCGVAGWKQGAGAEERLKARGQAAGRGRFPKQEFAESRRWLSVSRHWLFLTLPLALSTGVLLFPIMGFSIPWRNGLENPKGRVVRLLTCNLCGSEAALTNLLQDSNRLAFDVLCLQECPAQIPSKWREDWNLVRHGQVAIVSKYAIDEVQVLHRQHPPCRWPPVNAVVALVHDPDRDLRIASVHMTTPRPGLSEVLDRQTGVAPSRRLALMELIDIRREESRAVTAWLDTFPDLDVVAGDFNMPDDSAILREYWTARYTDAFSAVGFGLGHTKHTPVGPFQYGLRIDHILLSSRNTPLHCQVGETVGSDHLPLHAAVVFSESSGAKSQ